MISVYYTNKTSLPRWNPTKLGEKRRDESRRDFRREIPLFEIIVENEIQRKYIIPKRAWNCHLRFVRATIACSLRPPFVSAPSSSFLSPQRRPCSSRRNDPYSLFDVRQVSLSYCLRFASCILKKYGAVKARETKACKDKDDVEKRDAFAFKHTQREKERKREC